MTQNSKQTLVSIVIPVFNEEDNLEPLYGRVKKLFEGGEDTFELIVIDDGSLDQSLETARQLSGRDPRVKILSFSRNFGHQAALSAGIDYAQGAAVILMDADLQHPPEVIPALLKKWREGYENVYTIRKAPPGRSSLFKKYSSAFFYRIFRALTKLDLPANSADFRLLDRKVVLQLRDIRERTRFLRGLICWTGFKSAGIEYEEGRRESGRTKYGFKSMLFFAVDAIFSFARGPLYLGIFLGAIFALFGLCYFVYALYIYIFARVSVPGWASIICLLSVLGGIQLVVMGLTGIYVGKIFEEVKQRPLYIIKYSKGIHE